MIYIKGMRKSMKLAELLKDVPYLKIEGSTERPVEAMYYDSRKVTPRSLFFCIQGFTVDGHDYAPQAVEKGSHVLVLEKDVSVEKDVTKVFVEDSRKAMAFMARNFYGNPGSNVKLIGVTGTNGKTTTTYLIKSILERAGHMVGLIGTITNMIGDKKIPAEHTTPESLDLQKLFRDMVDMGVTSIVMEVSSHSLALERVAGCEYDIGVFTNLTQDHLDFHKTIEEYRQAKAKLFKQSKISIINVDDENGQWIKDGTDGELYTYGIRKDADIYARDLEIGEKGVSFELYTPKGHHPVSLGIPGIFTVYNALAAAGACYALNIPLPVIAEGLGMVKGVAGRFELLDTQTDYSVILDYAHTPDGLENILKTASQFARGRIVTLFGCGGDRDPSKRPLMGEIAGKYSDFCIITSDNPRSEDPMKIIEQIIPGIEKTKCPYVVIEDRKEAIRYALHNAEKDDVIILAGKGHETYQILRDRTIHFDEKEIVAEILGREKV